MILHSRYPLAGGRHFDLWLTKPVDPVTEQFMYAEVIEYLKYLHGQIGRLEAFEAAGAIAAGMRDIGEALSHVVCAVAGEVG